MVNKYPRQLTEPIRLEIAVDYLQHEMRKIFPGIKDKSIWNKLDREIAGLNKNKTMVPVRDFWNLVDAVCLGLKLKDLVPRLTSQNLKWSKEKITIDDLYLSAKKDFICLNKLNNDVPNGKEVREFLFAKKNKAILKFAKQDSLLNSKKTADRDVYPIMVGPKNNKIMIYDGNRRTIRHILQGKKEILAYRATLIKTPMFYNYWVPTSRMLNLASHANLYLENNDQAGAKALSQALGYLIKFSTVAKKEFYDKVISNKALPNYQFILKEVEKIIKTA